MRTSMPSCPEHGWSAVCVCEKCEARLAPVEWSSRFYHSWDGDTCSRCGAVCTDHDFSECCCAKCRTTRHDAVDGKCVRCGVLFPHPDTRSLIAHVVNGLGLHARAITKVVQLANRFRSEITIVHGDSSANAKESMGLYLLCAAPGSTVEIRAAGADADHAIAELGALFRQGFGEVDR
jgi:phosphocarrier protein